MCLACGRYWAPRAASSGRCPVCGGPIDRSTIATHEADVEAKAKLPWHLKLLAVAFVLYLAWRLFQGVEWLVHHV